MQLTDYKEKSEQKIIRVSYFREKCINFMQPKITSVTDGVPTGGF